MSAVKPINFSDPEVYDCIFSRPDHKEYTRYLIHNKIGSGTYGRVHMLTNVDTSIKYAAKLTPRISRKSAGPQVENVNEVEFYKKISQLKNYGRYFPEIYHIFTCFWNIYIVMEYLPGGYFD